MDQLPSNSHVNQGREQKAETKKVEKVVQGEVTTRKRSWRKRLSEAFLANRADTVGEFVFWDIMVPAAKNTFVDSVSSFANQMVFGSGGRGRATSIIGQSIGQYVSNAQQQVAYNRVGNPVFNNPGVPQPQLSSKARAMHDFKEILIPTRVEADEVLGQLLFRIREYNSVTVADFYELCGITPNYTDDRWGWVDIRGAGVLPTRNGMFVLDLPAPTPLD